MDFYEITCQSIPLNKKLFLKETCNFLLKCTIFVVLAATLWGGCETSFKLLLWNPGANPIRMISKKLLDRLLFEIRFYLIA